MDGHDRKRYQVIQVPFAERVDSIEMLGYITCLSEHTRDTVRNSQTAHNGSKLLAAQTLFAALKCRPDGLQQAADALRKCGHDDLADKIDTQQASSHHLLQQPQQGVYQLQQQPYYQHQPGMYSPHGDQAEVKNDLNEEKSDTKNEDSDFTLKKNIEQEENISSVPDSDSSKILNNQENAEFIQTLTNKEDCSVKPQATGFDSNETTLKEFDSPKGSVNNKDNNATRTGFDSSETTLKSPITGDENKDTSNAERTIKLSLRSEAIKNNFEMEIIQAPVENIRQECFSDVYSHTALPLPSATEVSTERTANVEATQQPVDQSLEDARIPEMRYDDDELNSIWRKQDKAHGFGIYSYNKDDDDEDGDSFASYSEGNGSAVNSGEDIISTDAIPTTMGANTNDMNEYFEQMNLNDHPEDSTKDQTKNNNVQKSKTATNNGTDANNQTNNQQERGGVSKSDGNRIPSIQCPSLDTSAQFACEYRVFDDIGQRPETAEYVRADNSTDERLTSWISLGSSFASFTYKVLHPDV